MARTWCRPAGASKRFRRRALVWLLWAGLLAAAAGNAWAQAGDAAPAGAPAANPDVLRVQQSLTLSLGRLTGSREGFLRHEEGHVPSLNPDVRLSGELLLRTSLPGHFRLDVHSVTGDKPSHTLGLAYRDWSLRIGPRPVSFARAGLAYTRWTSGAALLYEAGSSSGSGPALEVVAARTTSRTADVTLSGDDSFGPYFLGHRQIIEQSEQILLDGQLQRRGAGPGDGDYYMDYQGGFVYFNKVVLSHQRIRAVYQYEVDDPALSSRFLAVLAGYDLGGTEEQRSVSLRGFFLRDHLPVDNDAILLQAGSTLTAYGAHVESFWSAAGGSGTTGVGGDLGSVGGGASSPASAGGWTARLLSTFVYTDLQRFSVQTVPRTHQFHAMEGQREYRLPHRPVLYQSEQVTVAWGLPGVPDETLIRTLDYVIDYHSGLITFAFDLPPGSRVTVEYEQVTDGAQAVEELAGLETRQRLEYRSRRWRTSSWLELAGDGYVSPATLRPPETRLSAGTVNEYVLTDTWSLLGDLTVTERQQSVVYRPAVGAAYNGEPWTGRLRLVGGLGGGTAPAAEYGLDGQLRWRGAADVGLEFSKRLDATGAGWAPEWYRLAAVGVLGRLPYAVTFTHGDEQYKDKLEARLTLPGSGARWRGSVTAGVQLLYPETVGEEPRTVYSLFGNASYTGEDGMYVRVQGAGALSRYRSAAVESGTLSFDAGRSWGRLVADYQLRASLLATVHEGARVEGRFSLSHVATLAAAPTDHVSGAVVYRWTKGSRERSGRGTAATSEQGWQVAVNLRWSPSWTTSLTYDLTRSVTTGTALPGEPAAPTGSKTRRWQFMAEYGGATWTFRLTGTWGLHDDRRQRNALELRPAYRLSEHAEWWMSYEFVDARDAARPDEAYTVHQLTAGLTFRL